MQFSKTLLALFATATALAGAYTFDDGDAFGDLEARDLHADEHYLAARSAAGDAAVDYLEARDAHRALQKRVRDPSTSSHFEFPLFYVTGVRLLRGHKNTRMRPPPPPPPHPFPALLSTPYAPANAYSSREAHALTGQLQIGGNGECKAAGKSGKAHCMKNGRSCAAKGCKPGAKNGDYCLCDAGFKG